MSNVKVTTPTGQPIDDGKAEPDAVAEQESTQNDSHSEPDDVYPFWIILSNFDVIQRLRYMKSYELRTLVCRAAKKFRSYSTPLRASHGSSL